MSFPIGLSTAEPDGSARSWTGRPGRIGPPAINAAEGIDELAVSRVAALRGKEAVAIGNVVGSNLFNILGTLGLSGLIRPVQVSRDIVAGDNFWMLGLTLLIFPIILTHRRVERWEGSALLGSYGLFLFVLLGRPPGA